MSFFCLSSSLSFLFLVENTVEHRKIIFFMLWFPMLDIGIYHSLFLSFCFSALEPPIITRSSQ